MARALCSAVASGLRRSSTIRRQAPDTDILRERIGFAAERLTELEVGALTGATYREKARNASPSATATASGPGRPGLEALSCASPNYGRAAIFLAFWSRGG